MTLTDGLTIAACVGAATSGGVFFGFSTFVMRALGDLPTDASIRAMQAINRRAPNAWFMGALFGTAAAGIAATIAAVADERTVALHVVSTLCYLAGLVLTIAFHVPRNDRLAEVDASSAESATWTSYARPWTAANHVRTTTCVLAALGYALALAGS